MAGKENEQYLLKAYYALEAFFTKWRWGGRRERESLRRTKPPDRPQQEEKKEGIFKAKTKN